MMNIEENIYNFLKFQVKILFSNRTSIEQLKVLSNKTIDSLMRINRTRPRNYECIPTKYIHINTFTQQIDAQEDLNAQLSVTNIRKYELENFRGQKGLVEFKMFY